MSRFRIVCLIALISAGAASAAQGGFDVRLIEPAEHAVVVAGSTVPIAWEAGRVPAGIEEWEAFLSIDGGQTYPIRITPHLDAGIHRFTWIVPSLPGADVSILLRFGDEQEERQFPFHERMRISGDLPLETFRQETLRETGLSQSAPEEDHGQTLTEWVDGARDGSDLRHVVVEDGPRLADYEWNGDRDHDSAVAIGSSSKRVHSAVWGSRAPGDGVAESRPRECRQLRQHGADILLMTRRLNI